MCNKLRIRKRRSLISEYLSKPNFVESNKIVDTINIMRKSKIITEGKNPITQTFYKKEKVNFVFKKNIELNDSIFEYYLKDFY